MFRVLLISAVLFAACKNQEKSIKITDYASITLLQQSKSNIKPQNGQYCLVDYITEFNDTTYEYSEDISPEGLTYVFNADEAKNKGYNQFSLAFSHMEVGDSAAVRMEVPKDFLEKAAAKGMPMRDYVVTYMRLKKIMTQLEADAFNAGVSAKAMLDYHQAMKKDSMVGQMVFRSLPSLSKKDFSGFTALPSGVQYKVLNQGKGKKPEVGSGMRFDLCVYTTQGKKIASSYARASPESFRLSKGKLLAALYEVMPNVSEGSSVLIFSPPSMAYGDKGNADLPPNSDVIVYVDLLKVRK